MTNPDLDHDRAGALERHGDSATVRFTRRLAHPIDKVWRAITEPEHLAAWFPTSIDGERRPGATLSFAFSDIDLPPMAGTMRAYEPPNLIEMAWGDDIVRIELRADTHGDGEATVLVLSDTFAELGKAARDGAGWHLCLDNLDAHVDGRPAADQDGWRALNAWYVEHFGPDAATVGPPQEWEDAHGTA